MKIECARGAGLRGHAARHANHSAANAASFIRSAAARHDLIPPPLSATRQPPRAAQSWHGCCTHMPMWRVHGFPFLGVAPSCRGALCENSGRVARYRRIIRPQCGCAVRFQNSATGMQCAPSGPPACCGQLAVSSPDPARGSSDPRPKPAQSAAPPSSGLPRRARRQDENRVRARGRPSGTCRAPRGTI